MLLPDGCPFPRAPFPRRMAWSHGNSRGLEEFFFGHIHGLTGLTLLDWAAPRRENVSFITDLGHRLSL